MYTAVCPGKQEFLMSINTEFSHKFFVANAIGRKGKDNTISANLDKFAVAYAYGKRRIPCERRPPFDCARTKTFLFSAKGLQ